MAGQKSARARPVRRAPSIPWMNRAEARAHKVRAMWLVPPKVMRVEAALYCAPGQAGDGYTFLDTLHVEVALATWHV